MISYSGDDELGEDPVARFDDMPRMESTHEPDWRVPIGHGIEMGVTVDDGCFVALTQDEWGYWNPVAHVPAVVAQSMGQAAELLLEERSRR